MWKPRLSAVHGASLLVYGVLLLFALLEQFGQTTSDTKTPLIERPLAFLQSAGTLWNPQMNFGELQNQAYGYLFPQGPFFVVLDTLHVAPWVTERLWSVLVLVIGCEGARLVARAIGLDVWPAWVAGMAFGLNARVISQVGVRSAEVLPTAVLPWVVLPIVLALTGRLPARRAALFSAVAFLFSGAVNATGTVAGLPLVAILIVWGVRRGLARWSLLGWWCGFLALTNVWWVSSLFALARLSPPFFDYVEDVSTTTETTGYQAALRGMSNWVNYTFLGNQPNWPAGYDFAMQPALVVLTGLVAVLGVLGLVTMGRPWRAPLVAAAVLGLVSVTIAHTSPLQSPLAPAIQVQLDGLFALLRNVSKADPMLRLPLALGVGVVFARVLAMRLPRGIPVAIPATAVVALVLGMAQPAVAMELRTPGWDRVPAYWEQTADFLASADGQQRAWLVPGSGFALQSWGWTVDEPMQSVARTPWVSRSQVPLTPPQTIRVLSYLEGFLETGSGSASLGETLGRLGFGFVVVRHDLDASASESTTSNLVSIALARSRGVTRVATFGTLDFGPAVEVFRVTRADVAPDIQVRPEGTAATVAGASSDVVAAVGDGLISPDRVAAVQGDSGWDRAADVVGDTYRLRERNFGRVHDAEGPVLSPTEPTHGDRVVQNYPGNTASTPVHARYRGIAYATASTSQGFTNGLGAVMPEAAPYAAVDGDPATGWRSSYVSRPRGQWLEVRYDGEHALHDVTIHSGGDPATFRQVRTWRVTAGGRSRNASVDPFTGLAEVDLGGVRSDRLRITAAKVDRLSRAPVQVFEVAAAGLPAGRTLVEPGADLSAHVAYVLSAHPETRACIATLLAPDCDPGRQRLSEESAGIDRVIDVPDAGTWTFDGIAVARARPGTEKLLEPLRSRVVMHASSTLASDPTVSVRSAYDGSGTTSWIADPGDARPRLVVDWPKAHTVDQVTVNPPASPAVSPTTAVLRSEQGVRRVSLGDLGRFEPLRTRHLEITFANPTQGSSPIGLSELYLGPRNVVAPLDGGARTGSVCGFGPNVFVDGKRYQTRVDGFVGDVVSAGPLRVLPCFPTVAIPAGEHRVRIASTEQFQPVSARLVSTRSQRPPGPNTIRSLRTVEDGATRQELRVGSGPASVLSTTRNFNAGWAATLDGRPLRTIRVDGWAQGWRLPEGDGGRIVISYGPQASYLVLLLGGLAFAGIALLLALVLLFRTRLSPLVPVPVDGPHTPPERLTRREWGLRTAAFLVGGWVFAGVPAALGVLLGALVGRPTSARWLGIGLMLASVALTAAQLVPAARLRFDVADVLAGTGFFVTLMSLLPRPGRRS